MSKQQPSKINVQGRQTKVVCTVGPACRSEQVLAELIEAGMDVARLHFSYGSKEDHQENIARLRAASKQARRRIGILQDLTGAKVRMLDFGGKQVRLEEGKEFTLLSERVEGDETKVSLGVPELIKVVEKGDTVLLNDGALTLRAISTTEDRVRCKVIVGGTVKAQQSVHVPGKAPDVRVPTEKDLGDVRFGIAHGVDWIALSYARSADEVRELQKFIRQQGADTPVVVKIERRAALDELEAMIRQADAVMVARGDLGLEIPIEEIALVQKDIIHLANAAGKPVITATEMLMSMMDQPRPTRADVSDITNAILDGTDAVMLSGETAIGKHPVKAVEVMAQVARKTDRASADRALSNTRPLESGAGIDVAIARAACGVAQELKAKLILCPADSAGLVRLLSAQHSSVPIVAVAFAEQQLQRITLFRGVHPVRLGGTPDRGSLVSSGGATVLKSGLASQGDCIVIVDPEAERGDHKSGPLLSVEVL